MAPSRKKSSTALATDAADEGSSSKAAGSSKTAGAPGSGGGGRKRRASPSTGSTRAPAASPVRTAAPSTSPVARHSTLAQPGAASTAASTSTSTSAAAAAASGSGVGAAGTVPQSEAARQAIANAKAAGFTLPPGAIPLDFESDEATSDGDFLDDEDVNDGKDYGDDARAESATCQWESCGKVFYHLEPLIEHVQDEHLASNPNRFFVCNWTGCSRGAKVQMSRFSMMSHLRSHTGEKPYACPRPECDKGFARSDALSKHLKQFHLIQPIPNRRTAASAMKKARARAEAEDDEDGDGGAGPSHGGGAEDESMANTTAGPGGLSIRADDGGAEGNGPGVGGEHMFRVKSEYDALTSGLGMGSFSHPIGALETAAAAASRPAFSWGKGAPPPNEILPGFQYAEGNRPPPREALLAQDYADLEDEVVLARARDMRKRAREQAAARRRVLAVQPSFAPASAAGLEPTAADAEAELEWELLQSDEASTDDEDEGVVTSMPAEEEEGKARPAKRARNAGGVTPTAGTVPLPTRNATLDASALISNSRTSHTNGSSSASTPASAQTTNGRGTMSKAAAAAAATAAASAASEAALAKLHRKYMVAKAKLRFLETERVQLEEEYALVRQEALKEKVDTTAVLEQVLVAELGQDVEAIFSPQTSPVLSPLAL